MRCVEGERMISTCAFSTVKHGVGGVMVWGCFAGDTVCDLFRIQGTLNQHGYHSILQQYTIPSGLGLVYGLFYQEGEWWSAASDDRASTIWDGLWWVWPQSEGKAANKSSAYVGTPSRCLKKHSSWSWLRECQECAKLSPRQRVAILKNLRYKIYLDLFNTFLDTTLFHVLFHTFDVFTIILQCRK